MTFHATMTFGDIFKIKKKQPQNKNILTKSKTRLLSDTFKHQLVNTHTCTLSPLSLNQAESVPLAGTPPIITIIISWAWRQQACRWFSYVSYITCQCRGGGLTQSMCYTCSV